ncbi:MAG: hypothetical protein AB7S38_34895 [Vulcanimicrobiota bacterium]
MNVTATDSLKVLLSKLIDYAGLFPPARQDMARAVADYRSYQSGPYSWALGTFVCPVNRLEELVEHLGPDDDLWEVSAIATLPLDETLERVRAVTAGGKVRVVAIESQARPVAPLELDEVELYLELGSDEPIEAFVAQVAKLGAAAKLRTGGLSPENFPTVERVAALVTACAQAGVALKATAGLHHPLPGLRPVEGGTAAMHGFVNLFLGPAVAPAPRLVEVLADSDPGAFRFEEQGASWRDLEVSLAQLESHRQRLRSFGSCSFVEPLQDLEQLGWL